MANEVIDLTKPGFFSSEDFVAAKILLGSGAVAEGTCFMPGRSGDTRHETIVGLDHGTQRFITQLLGWR